MILNFVERSAVSFAKENHCQHEIHRVLYNFPVYSRFTSGNESIAKRANEIFPHIKQINVELPSKSVREEQF